MASFFRPAQQPASQYQGALLTAPASPVVRAGSLVQRTSLELSGCQRMGSNPAPGCSAARVGAGECCVTCDSGTPAVTAGAHRGPAVSDATRTQRGPGRPRSRLAPVPSVRRRLRRSGPPRPGTGSACRARLAVSPLEGLEGGPLVCLAASRSWSGKVRCVEAAHGHPADWRMASNTDNRRRLLGSTQLWGICAGHAFHTAVRLDLNPCTPGNSPTS